MPEIPREWFHGDKLTTSQVANLFNVSKESVVRWTRAGHIGFFLTPQGERRFPESEIVRVINHQPAPPEIKELNDHFNAILRKRWETGFRRNSYMADRAGLPPQEEDDA